MKIEKRTRWRTPTRNFYSVQWRECKDLNILKTETKKGQSQSQDCPITITSSFECLWNPKNQKYKCRNTKHDAWRELSAISGADETEVKRKIKNLISQFFRERKKYLSFKRSGAGAYFVSKWFLYNNMLFLADKNKPRHCTEKGLTEKTQDFSSSSDTDFQTEEPASPTTSDTENLQFSQETGQTQENIEATQTEDISSPSAVSSNQPVPEQLRSDILTEQITITESQPGVSTPHKSKVFKSPKTKTRKRSKIEIASNERQEEAYMVLQELKNKKPRSRFQVFGEHVGLKIESLSTEFAKNTVEHLISNILWEAAMGKYDYGLHMIPYNSNNVPVQGAPNNVPVQRTPLSSYSPTDSYSSSYLEAPSCSSYCSNTQFQLTTTPEISPNETIDNRNKENNSDKDLPGTESTFSDVLQEALKDAGI